MLLKVFGLKYFSLGENYILPLTIVSILLCGICLNIQHMT